jgi:hypothetical protein
MTAFGPVVALANVIALKVGALHDRGVIKPWSEEGDWTDDE